MSDILDITEQRYNKRSPEVQRQILNRLFQFCTGSTEEPLGKVTPCFKLMTPVTGSSFEQNIGGMFYKYKNLAISVQFGYGNYSSNYDGGVSLEKIELFEIAFVKYYDDDSSHGLLELDNDTVAGYVHRRNIKALIDKVLHQDYGAKSLREISLRLARAIRGIESAKSKVRLRKRE